jgi:hypothetical protein
VWLTWRLMEQDRNLELERSRERLEQTADLAVAELARSLGDWDLGLRELKSLPPSSVFRAKLPAGATFILIAHGAITVSPPTPLLFVPNASLAPAASSRPFDIADGLELRSQQYDRAIAALQPLVNDPVWVIKTRSDYRISSLERLPGAPSAGTM